jgi:hypothetical protein
MSGTKLLMSIIIIPKEFFTLSRHSPPPLPKKKNIREQKFPSPIQHLQSPVATKHIPDPLFIFHLQINTSTTKLQTLTSPPMSFAFFLFPSSFFFSFYRLCRKEGRELTVKHNQGDVFVFV